MSRLVVMGSGETAPTMVRVHREVFAATPPGPALMLDTPFAFQVNREELVTRTRAYFADSVGRNVEVVAWPPPEADPLARERALALLDRAAWVFAGPGSPTYALGQWRGTAVPAALSAVLRRGGTLVLGSAAAVTAGSHAVPVYEIYKVGQQPVWVEGLDVLGELTGIRAAVIPHFDNREGATHDTRFCYLGEARLAGLEASLPDEVGVLGVDEHTAVVLDRAAGWVRVLGSGGLSVRRRGATSTLPAGVDLPIARLAAMVRGDTGGEQPVPPVRLLAPEPGTAVVTSLHEVSDRARADFEAALARRDAPGCVRAVLALEQGISDWSSDTLQSSDREDARRVLRALVARLGELAEAGSRDPREVLAPYVDLLLDLRASARAAGDYALSDRVRDRLGRLGVEVRDSPGSVSWDLPGS